MVKLLRKEIPGTYPLKLYTWELWNADNSIIPGTVKEHTVYSDSEFHAFLGNLKQFDYDPANKGKKHIAMGRNKPQEN